MASKEDVAKFLRKLKIKMEIFGVLFLDDRGKNQQTLQELEISPSQRKEVILKLGTEDYSEGPLEEKMRGILPMWVFGKEVRGKEIYIKMSMGNENNPAICISFHIAEFSINYPYKN